MVTINPHESFPIVRILKDHTDAATYYVRAVIRDATTDAIIETVNLTDKGDRRFAALWKAPTDNAYSSGRFVIITTTVYTDAGFTTKSENHYEEADTYLVQQRWEQQFSGGGGGFTPEEVRKAIREEIKPTLGTARQSDAVANALLTRVENAIRAIPKPENAPQPAPDLSPIEQALTRLTDAVNAIPRPKEIDLEPIYQVIREQQKSIATSIQQLQDEISSSRPASEIDVDTLKTLVERFTSATPANTTNSARATYLRNLTARYA